MRIRSGRTGLLMLLFLTVLPSCTSNGAPTLYRSLGGEEGIARITDLFILEIANDKRVIHYFEVSNVQRFRDKFSEHLCMISDGPCDYTGDSLVDTHAGMDVTEGAFDSIVEDLITAMDKAGISQSNQNRLLERLAALRGEVIYR